MNSPIHLFYFRLKKGWQYQYKVWKTAVDWTIWLYILIPATVIAFINYYELYNGEVVWAKQLPEQFTLLFLFILSWTGMIRLFVEEGDLLFLRQKKSWLDCLMKLGIAYSILKNFLFCFIVFWLLYPILAIYNGMIVKEIVLLFLLLFLFRLSIQFVKQFISVRFQGWRLLLINLFTFIATFAIFFYFYTNEVVIQMMALIILSVTLFLFYNRRINMYWSFQEDCMRELQEKMKLTNTLMGIGGFKVEKRYLKRRKPFILLPNSMQFYKERSTKNIITELFIKFIVRNIARLFVLIQISLAFMSALVIAPLWIKRLLLIVCMFIIVHLVRGSWKDLKNHSFYKLFFIENKNDVESGVKRGMCIITIPMSFVFGYIVGIMSISFFGAFIAGGVCSLLTYFYIRNLYFD